jgi:CRP/FNR family cyclic AMP-dependent transcriptional regulator
MRKVLFILSELLDEDVDWLATHGERRTYARGAELIGFNAEVDTVYFVLGGSFAVLSAGGDVIVQLGMGEIIGEMSLVDPARTTASVYAHEDSVALAVPHEVLRRKLNGDCYFAGRFYRALSIFLADRVRHTTRFGFGPKVTDPTDTLFEYADTGRAEKDEQARRRFSMLIKRMGALPEE